VDRPRRLSRLARVGSTAGLILVLGAGKPSSGHGPPAGRLTDGELEVVSSILGRPVGRLTELDRRLLPLAFVEGRYETFVLRDRETEEVLKVTLDRDALEAVDPQELRSLDRERAATEGAKLTPGLRDLVLRHPELSRIEIGVRLSREATEEFAHSVRSLQARVDEELARLGIEASLPLGLQIPPEGKAALSVAEIVMLCGSPLIDEIELLADPVVLDDTLP
jgi:hypothetical protein